MQLTDRFLCFADQQLAWVSGQAGLRHLGRYLSQPAADQTPSLVLIRQWSIDDRQLPAADNDPELRLPARGRRWYPLQDGDLILGALRADLDPRVDWTADLDSRLRLCAGSISHGLSRELECLQLRDQLTQQQDQLRTLIHQLRNPLAALRTYAQLLLRRLEADSQHRPLVEGVLTEQNQLGLYIDALAGLGGPTLPASSDPSAPLLLPPGSAESDITLKERLVPLIERAKAMANLPGRPWSGPDDWPAWSEQTQGGAAVSEIVANLLENGFRYSPPGCAIGLALMEDGLAVWDAGPPIADHERSRIFERGVRGEAGQERPGTGLGLALARHLAERNGGSLELCVTPGDQPVVSPNSGLPMLGNLFRLTLPPASVTEPEA